MSMASGVHAVTFVPVSRSCCMGSSVLRGFLHRVTPLHLISFRRARWANCMMYDKTLTVDSQPKIGLGRSQFSLPAQSSRK